MSKMGDLHLSKFRSYDEHRLLAYPSPPTTYMFGVVLFMVKSKLGDNQHRVR